MAKDKLGENDKPEWAGPTATKFEKYVSDRDIAPHLSLAHRTHPTR
jgi:hypothetical protein